MTNMNGQGILENGNNRHPGLIPNTVVNVLVSHYDSIQVPLSGAINSANTLTVPFMTDLGTGVSLGLKVEFINRARRVKVKSKNEARAEKVKYK